MKKIILKQLRLVSFKGIKSLKVGFPDNATIYGNNATGKTTIFDAFLWLLFGKDSSDRTDFEIKHISQNGTGVTKETEVEGSLAVNGQEIILKRIYREKWMRKRGAAEVEFTGHETIYHYNDVPITQKEYNVRIADICPEHLFRLITNPLYFTSLKWQMQRELLFNMVSGDGSDSELAEGNPAFESLLNELSGKTLDDFKKQLANAKRRVKDELDLIPARIDEVNRSLPAQENWDELNVQLTGNMQLLSQIEASIEDQSQAYQEVFAQRSRLQLKLHQSRSALQQIMMNAEDALNTRKVRHGQHLAHTTDALKSLQLQIHRIQEEIAGQNTNRDTISLEMEELRSKWHTENSKELIFDGEEFICPTCKRSLDVDDVENKRLELEQTFNRAKVKTLQLITDTGTRLKHKLDASNQAIGKYQESLKEKGLQQDILQQQLTAMQAKVINSQVDTDTLTGYAELKQTISSLEHELNKQVNMPDVDALKRDKMVVKLRIDDINKTLALKDIIGKSRQRTTELEQEQQTLAQELADMERTEFTIQAFERSKVESLERKVNNMFELAKFKLFDTQINGQEIPTCQATYQNVPYADLNTAMKINCGIDIINTMCKHEGITAPIFVDHAESVTRLHHTDSQLIRLVVSEKHATLTLS